MADLFLQPGSFQGIDRDLLRKSLEADRAKMTETQSSQPSTSPVRTTVPEPEGSWISDNWMWLGLGGVVLAAGAYAFYMYQKR